MKPKLRPVEVQQTPEGYLLSDPTGISPAALVLSPEALYLASLFTGEKTLAEIQAELERAGSRLPLEKLEELARALEEAGFLETPQIQARVRSLEETLKKGPKPMKHAGSSYPADPEAFRPYFETFLAVAPEVPDRAAKALLLPHLEPRRVPEVYGAAFRALKRTPAPERVLVLGVAHRPIQTPAAALATGFETPLGTLSADHEALATLDALLGYELFSDPLALLAEHSLEFAAVFLKAIWPETRVLPIAVASHDPAALDELGQALRLLGRNHPFFPVLSVDLSHVGARFDHGSLSADLAKKARERDLGYLGDLAKGEFEAAFQRLAAQDNDTYIDAFGPGRVAAPLIEGEGRILAYALSAEVDTFSAVGAGTLAWY